MPEIIDLMLSATAQATASEPSFRVGVKNAVGDAPAEMFLDGEIGDDYERLTSNAVNGFLRANKGKGVIVRINSPGGLVFDGITIHNALARHDGPVTTIIDGFAGSIASVIAVAGRPVQMYENAQLMVHEASVVAGGNKRLLREAADICEQCDEAIARTYKAKTGMALDKIYALMEGPGKKDGTWLNARQALAAKFIDEILPLNNRKSATAAVRDRSFSAVAARNERLADRQWLQGAVAKSE